MLFGSLAAHISGRLVLALAQIDDMAEQPIWCHLDVRDLDDHFRAHPVDPREHQGRSKPSTAWWWLRKGHPLDREWLKAIVQTLKLNNRHAGADTTR